MRKIILLAAAAACFACTKKNPNDLVVNVEVENMTVSNVALLIDRTTGFSIPLDKHGKGRLTISGLGNIYPHVFYGQASKTVFIGRGEEVTLRFDGRRFKDGIRVEGKNAEANAYLQSLSEPPFEGYELPWDDFRAKIDRLTEEAVERMKARRLEQTCPDFARIEEQRLRYYYAQAMLVYPMGHALYGGDPDYRPGPEVYEAVGELIVENEELADLEVYRDYLRFAIPMTLKAAGQEVEEPYDRTVATMRYIVERFSNDKVRQTMLRSLAIEYMQSNGIRHTEEMQNLVNAYLTDPEMLRAYREELESHDRTAAGRPSPDFEATDIEGRSYTLADFRGRYVYIDMWATWCAPCRAELPHLKALEKRFEGRNIAFVGLSIDKDKAAWEHAVRSGELTGTQLWLGPGSSFQQDYGVEGIPRFILLDPEGRIVDADMLRPSSEDTARLLDELQGI